MPGLPKMKYQKSKPASNHNDAKFFLLIRFSLRSQGLCGEMFYAEFYLLTPVFSGKIAMLF